MANEVDDMLRSVKRINLSTNNNTLSYEQNPISLDSIDTTAVRLRRRKTSGTLWPLSNTRTGTLAAHGDEHVLSLWSQYFLWP